MGLGQRRDELDRAGILVGRDRRLDVVLQALDAGLVAGDPVLQHHVRLDDLAALLVGAPTTAHSATSGWASSAASTSGPGDVVARRDDHVVGAGGEVEDAVACRG